MGKKNVWKIICQHCVVAAYFRIIFCKNVLYVLMSWIGVWPLLKNHVFKYFSKVLLKKPALYRYNFVYGTISLIIRQTCSPRPSIIGQPECEVVQKENIWRFMRNNEYGHVKFFWTYHVCARLKIIWPIILPPWLIKCLILEQASFRLCWIEELDNPNVVVVQLLEKLFYYFFLIVFSHDFLLVFRPLCQGWFAFLNSYCMGR